VREVFSRLRDNRSHGSAGGLCSVCSSHALVIEAAVRLAGRTKEPLLIEATANQVNQHGGYSGLAPDAFVALVRRLCAQNAVDPELVLVGGDHLGPWPWRGTPAEAAMLEAEHMVRHFVRAGAMKIHLDASMALADDPGAALDPGRAASRAVRLCRAAEEESRLRGRARPVYVIGTEVPIPGGEVAAGSSGSAAAPAPMPAPAPTQPGDFRETVALHQHLFHEAGLDDAWNRVVAVVVQPGIEFDALTVHPYRRDLAAGLVRALADFPGLLFEGHSTDFQSTSALRALVEDGFAVLKVGPELTFTLREALFGLGAIEEELLGSSEDASRLKATVLETMREKPESWKGYYKEDELLPFRMTYGYSDRVRYYWNQPRVACAVEKLLANLGRAEIPPQLISQFLPHLPPPQDQPLAARTPRELLLAVIEAQLSRYIQACRPAPAPAKALKEGGRT
jgi:D-tagatose-bisphosphate aldolase class II non-catalytic subunit